MPNNTQEHMAQAAPPARITGDVYLALAEHTPTPQINAGDAHWSCPLLGNCLAQNIPTPFARNKFEFQVSRPGRGVKVRVTPRNSGIRSW